MGRHDPRVLDRAIWDRSAQQHGLITADQLSTLGVSARALGIRRDDGRLLRVHPGVYRVAGAPTTRVQRILAACLSGGPDALVSHRTAAQMWRLDGVARAPIELVLPRQRRRQRQDFLVHESRDLRQVDASLVGPVPVTTPARTLVDLGAVIPPYRLEQALDDALRRRLVTLDHLAMRFREVARRGRRGVGPLRPLLEERLGVTLSPTNTFETKARRLAVRAGLPEPVGQHPVDLAETTVYLDLAWPAIKLAVECDSLAHHFAAHRLRWDDQRQNQLVMLGWMVLRVTWLDVTERAAETARLFRQAWATRTATLADPSTPFWR